MVNLTGSFEYLFSLSPEIIFHAVSLVRHELEERLE
jgi:hypothetical protein